MRKVKPLTVTIIWHYWIDKAQKSRKNGLTCKRKKCCSTKTMHRATSSWKRCQIEWIKLRIASSPTMIWPQRLLALCRPEKNAPGKEIWLQWRSDCRNWDLFWEQRRIILHWIKWLVKPTTCTSVCKICLSYFISLVLLHKFLW